MIFPKLNPEKIWHEKLTDLSTSPVICSHFILGNQEQFIFNSTTHTHFWLFMLHRRKQTVIHLPTTPENVTTLTCELQKFFVWLKVCCVLSRWRLWKEPVVGCHHWLWKEPVVMCGNWNVWQAMSQQVFRGTTFCMDTCFQSLSKLINRIVHHAVLKFSTSQQATAASLNMSMSIHALLL